MSHHQHAQRVTETTLTVYSDPQSSHPRHRIEQVHSSSRALPKLLTHKIMSIINILGIDCYIQ